MSIRTVLLKIAIKWIVPIIADLIARNLSKDKLVELKKKLVEAIRKFFAKTTIEIAGISDDNLIAPLLAKLEELNLEEKEYDKAIDALLNVLEKAVCDSDLKIKGIRDDDLILPLIRQLRKRLNIPGK